MPVWHAATREWVKQGKLVLLGITQEQHPDRCRLYAQWKQYGWPILHDPINKMRSRVVPIFIAIDEHGVVRSTRPRLRSFEKDFIDRDFPAPEKSAAKATKPDPAALLKRAERANTAGAWRDYGDAVALWQPSRADRAIDAYRKAIKLKPEDADAHFRLGVSYRMRYESDGREPGDFRDAVGAWGRALEIDPNQYIFRRRIQQYGPRLIKPYPFYDWVEQARKEIRGRGETPIELAVPPTGAEIARPSRRFAGEAAGPTNPDPRGRIQRDGRPLVTAEAVAVPARVKPGATVRLHVTLRPSAARKVHWTDEAGPTLVWIDPPEGWRIDRRSLTLRGKKAVASGPRHFEAELQVPKGAAGTVTIPAYALYYVCEGVDGQCLYLRRDITAKVDVVKR